MHNTAPRGEVQVPPATMRCLLPVALDGVDAACNVAGVVEELIHVHVPVSRPRHDYLLQSSRVRFAISLKSAVWHALLDTAS